MALKMERARAKGCGWLLVASGWRPVKTQRSQAHNCKKLNPAQSMCIWKRIPTSIWEWSQDDTLALVLGDFQHGAQHAHVPGSQTCEGLSGCCFTFAIFVCLLCNNRKWIQGRDIIQNRKSIYFRNCTLQSNLELYSAAVCHILGYFNSLITFNIENDQFLTVILCAPAILPTPPNSSLCTSISQYITNLMTALYKDLN